jgi:dipeptidyl aminopeptidase/acylaminoacyl peptidase
MRIVICAIVMIGAAASRALAGADSGITSTATPPRPFTVRDSIELASFVYPGFEDGSPTPNPIPLVSFSSDKSRFVVVTMRGDLTSGKREASLWLFESRDVRDYLHARPGQFAKAKVIARVASASNRWPLSNWRWSTDGRSILFLSADDDGVERLFRVSSDGGDPVPLSKLDQDVDRFDESNGAVVYLAHPPVRADELYQAGGSSLPDMEVGTGKNILSLLFPRWVAEYFHVSEDELWRIERGIPVPVIDAERHEPVRLKDSRLILAPDGHHAIVTLFAKHIPPSWERYKPAIDEPGFRYVADTAATEGVTSYMRPKQYAVMDLFTGQSSVLVDAPIELFAPFGAVLAQWSPDSSRVALVGVYPPLPSAAPAEPQSSIPPCSIMVAEVATKALSCASPPPPADTGTVHYGDRPQITRLQWGNGDKDLVAQYAPRSVPNQTTSKIFTQIRGEWRSRSLNATLSDDISAEVHEAIDEPPTLAARLGNGKPRVLLDPNPQLAKIALGKASLYHWRDAEGITWSGALVTPPDFSPRTRYALVIQTHGMDRSRFLADGPSAISATGFAARALAARHIVVLQVEEANKHEGTALESEAGAAGYRAAVKQLISEGIVEPGKVGILAWSHFGTYALRGMLEDPHAYAAATLAETTTNSYTEYLMNIDYMGTEREQMLRAEMGAKPFGEGLKLWLERSPGFHYDRICTPTLFQFNSPVALVYGWGDYAALRAQNKPVDLFYIRNGDHALVKPLERLAEQEMNVDWYDYWLNDHRDPDPVKTQQYARWDALRALPRCGANVSQRVE